MSIDWAALAREQKIKDKINLTKVYKLAQKGKSNDQLKLAYLYREEGLDGEAWVWIRKAAEQNNDIALYELGKNSFEMLERNVDYLKECTFENFAEERRQEIHDDLVFDYEVVGKPIYSIDINKIEIDEEDTRRSV